MFWISIKTKPMRYSAQRDVQRFGGLAEFFVLPKGDYDTKDLQVASHFPFDRYAPEEAKDEPLTKVIVSGPTSNGRILITFRGEAHLGTEMFPVGSPPADMRIYDSKITLVPNADTRWKRRKKA